MSESAPETHRRKMQKRKAAVDARIDSARIERGVLLVNTGPGKGKSSAGFGMALRAIGHGMRVGIVQFIKARTDAGEILFFQRHPENVDLHVMGSGFTWETQDKARDIADAQAAWAQATRFLTNAAYGLVLLDELNIALRYGYLDLADVLNALKMRPPMQHVVITGRNAPQELIEAADTVTEMTVVKHAFKAGIKAQRGIEW